MSYGKAGGLLVAKGQMKGKKENVMTRNETKQIRIGDVWIGGGNKVAIQSMTNTKTEDVKSTDTSSGKGRM